MPQPRTMEITSLASEKLLTEEERNWTMDEYLEHDETDHYCYFDSEATEEWLKTLSDSELVEEAVALMPGYLDALELTYGTRLGAIHIQV